jgi:RHS repeat-associated protein
MTQSLITPPKTYQRTLFLRKRGFLNLQKGGKPPKIPGAVAYRGNLFQKKFTGKEPDPETGLYYYGARYLDPKTSRWLSGDPALGEYFPSAPLGDEDKKRNANLPGQGGVFNYVNLHVYHYAGNNPVKYVDPDGRNDEDKKSDITTSSIATQVDIAATVAGVTIAKNASSELGKASTAIGIGAAVIDGVITGIQTESFAQGAFAVGSNVVSAVGGAIVGGVVVAGLTALSGGAGAPLAAAAGFYAGYVVGNAISNTLNSIGENKFGKKK